MPDVMAYPSLVLINNAISFSTGNFDGLLNRAREITFVCSKIRFRVNWFIWYLFLDIVPFESSVEIYFSIVTSIESCFFGRNFPRANLITFRAVCCAPGKYWWRTLSTKRKSWRNVLSKSENDFGKKIEPLGIQRIIGSMYFWYS